MLVVSATMNFYSALIGGLPFLQDNGLFQAHFRKAENEPVAATRLTTKVCPAVLPGVPLVIAIFQRGPWAMGTTN